MINRTIKVAEIVARVKLARVFLWLHKATGRPQSRFLRMADRILRPAEDALQRRSHVR
jgi:hypothetical protein